MKHLNESSPISLSNVAEVRGEVLQLKTFAHFDSQVFRHFSVQFAIEEVVVAFEEGFEELSRAPGEEVGEEVEEEEEARPEKGVKPSSLISIYVDDGAT